MNRLKQTVASGDFVQVAELGRVGRSVTEALESLGGLRKNQVEVISVRGVHPLGQRHGRAMLQLTIAFVKMERRPARGPGLSTSARSAT